MRLTTRIPLGPRSAVLGLAALLLLAACAAEPPPMALEEARKVAASIAEAPFIASPRRVDDILQMLAKEKPDAAKVAALRARAWGRRNDNKPLSATLRGCLRRLV